MIHFLFILVEYYIFHIKDKIIPKKTILVRNIKKLDYLLATISLCNDILGGIWKKSSRIVISYLARKDVMSERDFDVIIANAQESEYIDIKNEQLFLLNKGKQHFNRVKQYLIFYDDLKAIFNRLKSYNEKQCREYLKKLENMIKSIFSYNLTRKGKPNWPILTNFYKGCYKKTYFQYQLTNNQYINKNDFQSRYNLIKPIQNYLFRKNVKSLNKLGENKIVLITNKKLNYENLERIKDFKFNLKEEFDMEIHGLELEKHFISQSINQHLKKKKLVKLKNRFIDFSEHKKVNVEAGKFKFDMELYFGFKYEILNINDSEFIICIDPTYIQFINLRTLMQIKNIKDYKEFLNYYSNNKAITTLPFKRPGTLKDIKVDIKTDQIQYWKEKYNYDIKNIQGVANVTFEGNEDEYQYPLETVAFNKERIESELGFLRYNSEILTPKMRKNKIDEYFNNYLNSSDSIYYEFNFNERSFYLNELKDYVIEDYHFLLPPYLIFTQNNPAESIDYNPNRIFKFGGYSGKIKTIISKFIYPNNLNNLDFQSFFRNLEREFNRIFGKLEYDINKMCYQLDFGDKNRNFLALRDEINQNLRFFSPNKDSMVIVLNPDEKLKAHYLIKEAIINHWKIPDQHLQLSLFQDISDNNSAKIKGFALQLYIKSLKKQGTPWILAYPSDNEGKTVYCGIGFSMEEQRKEIGFLAMGDSVGKNVIQETFNLSNYTNYFTKELLDKIFSYLRPIIKQNNTNRIVLYKRGNITSIEKTIIITYLKELLEIKFWSLFNIDVISVEENITRLFREQDNKILNIDRGVMMIINHKKSIICTSGTFEISMPERSKKLVKINAEIINSDKTIYDITKEYYDRTFLNWNAPINPSKYPPELMLSNNLAKLAKEIDIKSEITYLVV